VMFKEEVNHWRQQKKSAHLKRFSLCARIRFFFFFVVLSEMGGRLFHGRTLSMVDGQFYFFLPQRAPFQVLVYLGCGRLFAAFYLSDGKLFLHFYKKHTLFQFMFNCLDY
jgi:hypothetical protein